jgi:hypothetical protein
VVRFGNTRELCLGLEVVTAQGELVYAALPQALPYVVGTRIIKRLGVSLCHRDSLLLWIFSNHFISDCELSRAYPQTENERAYFAYHKDILR